MFFVEVNTPVLGSKSSALAFPPPATSTLPFASKVAVWPIRAILIVPVRVKAPVAGLKSSAAASVAVPFVPPVSKTLPLASKVAVCPARAVVMLPARLKVWVVGLKSSAEARVPVVFAPPVIRTNPLASRVAVCRRRANCICPVAVKLAANAAECVRVATPSATRNAMFSIPSTLPPSNAGHVAFGNSLSHHTCPKNSRVRADRMMRERRGATTG